jgi:ATP-dependent Lon protease
MREILGPARFVRESRLATSKPGVVTGLAYTPAGGEVLHIEATRYSGTGALTLTGHIGQVMKESAQAALSLVRSRARELGIDPGAFKDMDIHIHVPSGAIPKDGPSAGVGMFTAIASLVTNTPVRSDTAMTGEITLRGLVLLIGGLKENARRHASGLRNVIITNSTKGRLPISPPSQSSRSTRETVDDVLQHALGARTPSRQAGEQRSNQAPGPRSALCAKSRLLNNSRLRPTDS